MCRFFFFVTSVEVFYSLMMKYSVVYCCCLFIFVYLRLKLDNETWLRTSTRTLLRLILIGLNIQLIAILFLIISPHWNWIISLGSLFTLCWFDQSLECQRWFYLVYNKLFNSIFHLQWFINCSSFRQHQKIISSSQLQRLTKYNTILLFTIIVQRKNVININLRSWSNWLLKTNFQTFSKISNGLNTK